MSRLLKRASRGRKIQRRGRKREEDQADFDTMKRQRDDIGRTSNCELSKGSVGSPAVCVDEGEQKGHKTEGGS